MTSDFQVLDDRQHVLKRAGMYIGKINAEPMESIINYKWQSVTIVPALIKLVEEIWQNAVDEHIRTNFQYATKISVTIESSVEGPLITIEDNGRGIPVEKHGNEWRPTLAWTALRAGSNFDDTNRVGAGAHGMGSALVNIFSKTFVGETSDGKNKCVVRCTDNMLHVNTKISASTKQYTKVSFVPDLEKFGIDTIDDNHLSVLRDRIENLSVLYPAISFLFNGEKIKFRNLKTIAHNFSEHAQYLEHDNFSLVIAPAGTDEEFRCLSYVNGIFVKNGGSHVDYMMNQLIDTIRSAIKKKLKIDVLPNQIKQHLLLASWISNFPNLKFDSQTKERVTNSPSDVSKFFTDVDFDKLSKKIVDTPEILDPITEAILRKRDALLAAELKKLNKDSDKANLRKISKFTDASEKDNRINCMLMITEGLSAASSVLSARTGLIGCYPLRGKPINALAATTKELLDNTEFSDLLAVTGLKIGKKVESLSDLRFGKIVFVSDADFDGFSISGLLMAMIRKFWPELFTMGAIYRFQSPIMKVMIGKKELYFEDFKSFEAFAAKETKPFKTRYLKGLGSSTADDFKHYFSEMDSRLEQLIIKSVADLDVIDMLYTKEAGAADRRKTWLNIEL